MDNLNGNQDLYRPPYPQGQNPQGAAYSPPEQTYWQPSFGSPLSAVKRRCSRAGVAVICAAAAANICAIVFTLALMLLDAFEIIYISDQAYNIAIQLISCVGMYVVAPIVMWLILRKLPYKKPVNRDIRILRLGKWILIAFGIDLSISLISSSVLTLFGLIFGMDSTAFAEAADLPWYITLLTTVIIAPIVEEIMFRRILLRRLLPDGELYAIVLSGIAFGLFHMNFYQCFYATALGFLFALIIVKTGKLWHTIALHMSINFLASVETMWLADYPLAVEAYEIFFIILMLVGLTILVIDIIKKDCTPEAAGFPKINGNWHAAVKSGGMIACWVALGVLSFVMTIVMMALY